jgi:hypothetical protein
VAALVAVLLLSTISIAAQVLYLELDALKGATHIPPGALDTFPLSDGWWAAMAEAGLYWAAPLGSMWPRLRAASS